MENEKACASENFAPDRAYVLSMWCVDVDGEKGLSGQWRGQGVAVGTRGEGVGCVRRGAGATLPDDIGAHGRFLLSHDTCEPRPALIIIGTKNVHSR